MRRTLFAIALAVYAAPIAVFAGTAANVQVKGADLHDLFFEKTAISEYRNFTGISDYMFSEFHNADGTTAYKEIGVPPVQGKWNLVGEDKICYTYPGVSGLGGVHCFFVFQGENGCYYNFARHAMTINGPRNWQNWTSRFVIKGEGGTCSAPVG